MKLHAVRDCLRQGWNWAQRESLIQAMPLPGAYKKLEAAGGRFEVFVLGGPFAVEFDDGQRAPLSTAKAAELIRRKWPKLDR